MNVSTFPFSVDSVPYLSVDQMRVVDRLMIEEYRITLIQMMENAGRNLAHLARERFLAGDPQGKRVLVLAGSGGNGGGALVAARRLHGYGAEVVIHLAREEADFTPASKHQLELLRCLGVSMQDHPLPSTFTAVHLLIDGMLGYSLARAPREPIAMMIRWANAHRAPTLALDVPSGIDATLGTVFTPAIEAAATLTLALPKLGLIAPPAVNNVGELYLADIGVPPGLYARHEIGLSVGSVFARNDIIRLRSGPMPHRLP